MNARNKEPEHQGIEALLPWQAAGTLRPRDANRVEQALAGDRELARQTDLIREEFVETIYLNETFRPPSARAMERLFAGIDAVEARATRHRRWFDLGSRVSKFLWNLTPRTLARSATAAAGDREWHHQLSCYPHATVVEGPLAGQLYRIRLSQAKLPKEEVNKVVSQMQSESKIVDFIVAKE
jgi:hypothetical protein